MLCEQRDPVSQHGRRGHGANLCAQSIDARSSRDVYGDRHLHRLPPTGTVTFTVDGVPGSPVTPVNGTTSFTTSTLAAGNHPATAAYGGNSNCAMSTSNGVTQTVNQSGLTLTSSPNPSPSGQPVTFTAMLTCPIAPASGTVTFLDNGTPIASLPPQQQGNAARRLPSRPARWLQAATPSPRSTRGVAAAPLRRQTL
jgi:Bacterial Ig-like domain (group 3)